MAVDRLVIRLEIRPLGNIALWAGGLFCLMGFERMGGWIAMRGVRAVVI